MLLLTIGCRAPAPAAGDRKPFGEEGEARTPFLQRGDYPDRLGVAIQKVLDNHGFSLPWIVVRGPDSSIWFVVDRFKSTLEFQRLSISVTSEERVTARITAYQFGPSDWAILGKLLVDFDPEARSIAAEISKELKY